ncbi:hypothetical protein ACVNPX_04385 [Staphylococcus aureus]
MRKIASHATLELILKVWSHLVIIGRTVRTYYSDFESDIKSPNTEIYQHEMPGGQYSNLSRQLKV